jgi:hypothetical protein
LIFWYQASRSTSRISGSEKPRESTARRARHAVAPSAGPPRGRAQGERPPPRGQLLHRRHASYASQQASQSQERNPLIELRESWAADCADRRVTCDRATASGTKAPNLEVHSTPILVPDRGISPPRTSKRVLHNEESTEHAACHSRPEICRHAHHQGEHSYQISLLPIK